MQKDDTKLLHHNILQIYPTALMVINTKCSGIGFPEQSETRRQFYRLGAFFLQCRIHGEARERGGGFFRESKVSDACCDSGVSGRSCGSGSEGAHVS